MILHLRGYYAASFCFPRVSGDDPQGDAEMIGAVEFSPRERG